MATKDEILNPPKGTKDWAEANSGENAVAPQAQTTVPAPIPTARSFDSNSGYDGLLSALPKPPKSQQELDDEMRRHRRSQIFNAIGDGLSALSNLYFTTKGAPNMYDGRNSAMRREDNRYRRMLEDNKSDYREYNNAVRVHDELADREWRRNRQSYMDEYDRKLKEAEHERDSQLFELQLRLQNHKISAADAEARRKQIEADYADELNLAKIDTERARARSYKASAGASNSRARYYDNGGGGGRSSDKYYGNFDGKDYKTKADYDEAIITAAKELGIAITEEQPDGRDNFNNPKTKIVRRPISEVAAEINKRQKEKKPNPMGGGKNNNGKKKNPMN